MIGCCHHNGIDRVQVLVIHFPEILIAGCFIVFLESFGCPALVHIAKAYIFYLPGLIQAIHNRSAPATHSKCRYIEGVAWRDMPLAEYKTWNN